MITVRALALLILMPITAAAAPVVTGQLDYRLSWNGIPAASATVNVSRDETGHAPHYRVEAAVRTSWLVDWLWRVGGRVASGFTARAMAPPGVRDDREVNDEHSVTNVAFDATIAHATGTYDHRGQTKVVDISEPGVVDPITAIFRALSEPVHIGDTLRYEVFTGEARYRVEFTITGEEGVTVAAGTFKAWKIEPHVWKLGAGADKRLRRATIWVSQEPARTLLRIRSEVFIGAVNCDLQRVAPQS